MSIIRYGGNIISTGGKPATFPFYESAPGSPYLLYKFDGNLTPSIGAIGFSTAGSISYTTGKIVNGQALSFGEEGGIYSEGNLADIWFNNNSWPNSDLTVNFWLNYANVADTLIYGYYDGTSYDDIIKLSVDGDGELTLYANETDGAPGPVTCTGQIDEPGWNMITVVRYNTWYWKLYVNAVDQDNNLYFSVQRPGDVVSIGYTYGNTDYASCQIDQMYWYLSDLTDAQIEQLYNFGIGI